MSTNEYTPTTHDMRSVWWWHRGGEGAVAGPGTAMAEFDRWLVGVVADARREAEERLFTAETALAAIGSIGAKSGTNINAWNDAFDVLDEYRVKKALDRAADLQHLPPVPSRVVVKESTVS